MSLWHIDRIDNARRIHGRKFDLFLQLEEKDRFSPETHAAKAQLKVAFSLMHDYEKELEEDCLEAERQYQDGLISFSDKLKEQFRILHSPPKRR